jgi:ribonuclease VapC
MFVDTSVFIALLTGEPDADALAEKLGRARHRSTSPLVRLETSVVLAARLDITPMQAQALFDELVTEAEITITPINDSVGRLAVEGFQAFGKGRHPAKLNIVDCFSYACAKALREPLLFKGEDFSLTDVNEA